jgi:hypothetical protein
MRHEFDTTNGTLYRINNDELVKAFEKSEHAVFQDSYGNSVCLYDGKSYNTYAEWAKDANIDYSDFAEVVDESDFDNYESYSEAIENADAI